MIGKKEIQAFQETGRVLLRARDYVYLLPHPALRAQISNYTVTFPSKEIISDGYTVIPHGSATLVFALNSGGLSGLLYGPLARPSPVGGVANRCEMLVIIEFQPGGLSAFARVNQKELADRTIPFAQVDPALNRRILEALESAARLDELVGLLDRRLMEALRASHPCALQMANRIIIENAGNISSGALSSRVYYSGRQLNRLFENYVGMNVKTFSRMVRINKAIRLLKDPRWSITRASCEAGYYDAPHFVHDFQAVCGMMPREYRANMSDFYNEIAKF